MKKIGLIIWREFSTRVRKASFLIMTILGPVLIAGGITMAAYLGLQETDHHQILVVDRAGLINDLRDTESVTYHLDQREWSDTEFKESPYSVMVDVNDDILNTNTVLFYYKELPSLGIQRSISNEIERSVEMAKLRGESIDEEAYRRVRKALVVKLFDIDKVGVESLEQERAGIGFFFGYFMFIFIFLYGVQVMRGVMEEKQNRVVEVLISSVKPFQLMMGKIVGIALVGFTQFMLWIVITITLITIGSALLLKDKVDPMLIANTPMTAQMQEQLGERSAVPDLNDVKIIKALNQIDLPLTLAMFVFYFIGGYLLYSSLLAAIGSAVDSESDTQQFMLPVTLPMIGALIIAQIAVYNPGSPAVIWCSLIPFTSPVVMMVRVAMGSAPAWHIILSMLLLIGMFLFTTWFAGRIYRTGILMYGKKASWREMGRWLFYKG
ncbi:MAG: ABC transporter permease [Bacteroidota bacterium]|nr:ABC transporter permease [Bacteroidota bacterium]